MALIRSEIDYCGAAWQSWVSPTGIKGIERAHCRAIRTVTGQLKMTPIEAIHCALSVSPLEMARKFLAAKAVEKARRLPVQHCGDMESAETGAR